ncbi:hypothetical protein Bca4012_056007 [Brassica carinata]
MARRYSRSEKEKWTETPRSPRKRSPIKIPEGNSESLIADNRLTLMGRVTNPKFQKPRAVVERMPQVWNLEGRVEGRDLGPEMFQFRFESESDLRSVLAKGPYHHKKWMLIIQRWEPTISPSFPSKISFWIRIHGLPLHYWTHQALDTIGRTLGHVDSYDVRDARIRVDINGLQPLEMTSEIQVPSGEVTNVDFEYLKIEKHCFTCFSLFHEETECPRRSRNDPPAKERKLGITQRLALDRIEADKRRHDERRGYRPLENRHTLRQDQHTRDRRDHQYSDDRASQDHRSRPVPSRDNFSTASRTSSDHRNSFHSQSRRLDYVPRGDSLRPRQGFSQRLTSNATNQNDVSAKSMDRTTDRAVSHGGESKLTPSPGQIKEVRMNTLEPEKTPPSQHSHERRSALDRVALPDLRDQMQRRVTLSGDSVRLQEVEIQLDEELHPGPTLLEDIRESATRNSALKRLGGLATQGSRERTRAVLGGEGDIPDPTLMVEGPSTSKRGTKRKATKPTKVPMRKKVPPSPIQGISIRKTNVIRPANPPRKKTTDKTVKDGDIPGPSTRGNKAKQASTVKIPTKRSLGPGFRSPPPSLP